MFLVAACAEAADEPDGGGDTIDAPSAIDGPPVFDGAAKEPNAMVTQPDAKPVVPDAATLPPDAINYSRMYILDWFEAFKHLAINNAGHAAGGDISPEQNARLGEILEKISGGGSGILTE